MIWTYLVNKGVPPERMTAKGYGSSRPINDTPQHMLRRCELVRTDVR